MYSETLDSITFLAICHLSILGVFLILMTWLGFCFFSGKIAFRTEKLIAIGITAILFSNTFFLAIVFPIARLFENLQRLFYLYNEYNNAGAGAAADPNKPPLTNLDQRAISYSDVFSSYPLPKLLFAAAFTLIIYKVLMLIRLNRIIIPAVRGTKSPVRIMVFNTMICLSLLLSLYFVISVFVTIPYLNEMRKPSVFTKAVLDSALNKISRSSEPLKPFTPNFFPSSVTFVQVIDSAGLRGKYDKLSEENRSKIAAQIASIDEVVKAIGRDRNNAIKRIETMAKDDQPFKVKTINKLTNAFEANNSNIAIDKSMLYQQLLGNFDTYLTTQQYNYKEAVEIVEQSDVANIEFLKLEKKLIADEVIRISADSVGKGIYTNVTYNYTSPYTRLLRDYSNEVFLSMYQRDGSDWGVLGYISGYLIKTKSQELVLLVGMIGFGILGASILSFVPSEDFLQAFSEQPVIKNFHNVLARGFGAALIIYLAAKGGLAIFSMGNNADPNGYILLLTCFIGAVFSEKVWTKVSNSLLVDKPQAQPPAGK